MIDIALTHISYCHEYPETRPYNRLAFVGSYLLDLVISNYCLKKFGWKDLAKADAEYTNIRFIIHEKLFEDLFNELQLTRYLRTVQKTANISTRVKIDVIQSIFATAFYWGGMPQVNNLWENLIEPNLQKINNAEIIDAVTSLQEYYQDSIRIAPNYNVTRDPNTPTHKPLFFAECFIKNQKIGEGTGCSKKEAKKAAASAALDLINKTN